MGSKSFKKEKTLIHSLHIKYKGLNLQLDFNSDDDCKLFIEALKRIQRLKDIKKREQFIEQHLNKEILKEIAQLQKNNN